MANATIYYTVIILVLVTILCMILSIVFLLLNYFVYICNLKSLFIKPMYYMIQQKPNNRQNKIFRMWK
jgi:hypothetical protein